jgi:hypothetical protein
MVRVYCCKYWQTQGIFPVDGEERPGGRFMAKHKSGLFQSLGESEWAYGTNEAVTKAKALREKKLQSLQREAQRILALEIKVTP